MYAGFFAIVSFILGVCALFSLIKHIFRWTVEREDDRQFSIKFDTVLLIIMVVVFITNTVIYNMWKDSLYQETNLTTYELVSISDNIQTEVKGSIFVYYRLSSNPVYTYYYKLSDGGYKMMQISATNTVVYEKEDCIPVVKEYISYEKSTLNPTLKKIACQNDQILGKRYEIIVPKGSLVKEYSLDAQ